MKKQTPYTDIRIDKKSGSQIDVSFTITWEKLSQYRQGALERINKNISLDGFRKGQVPEKVLINKLGEMTILQEMAEIAISESLVSIVMNEGIEAIGEPRVNITKLAPNNPLECTLSLITVPEVTLANYKDIARQEMGKNLEIGIVTNTEIEAILKEIQHTKAMEKWHNDKGHGEDHSEHTHPEENELASYIPTLDDAFAKSLGAFKSLEDLKEKIKTNVQTEKEYRAREKRKLTMIDAITQASTIDLPTLLVERELNRSEAQFRDDVARGGITVEDYLKQINKSIETLREEWRENADKKARTQLVLNAIAKTEGITADKDRIEREVQAILNHYKEADPEQARTYAESILTNEAVFEFLEKQN